MKKRIFNAILIMTFITYILAFFFNSFFIYTHVFNTMKKNVKNEATKIAEILNKDETFDLKNIITEARITLISKDGKVLYDNNLSSLEVENHLDRQEIQEALLNKSGSSTRFSTTNKTSQFYYAILLDNNNIIRISNKTSIIFALVFPQLSLIALTLLVIFIISIFIAEKVTRRILDPINKLNLQAPLNNNVYPEFYPLLKSLDDHNNLRKEFSANVSHELKTPLTSISGYAEIMANGISRPEDQKNFSLKIYSESQRLINKINDIIKISKLDENIVDNEFVLINYKDLIFEIINSLQMQIQEKNIDLNLDLKNIQGYAIKSIMYDSLYNLVQNAIKYNKQNGKIILVLDKIKNDIYIKVKDTGIGIKEEDLGRIFERFYRADKSHSSNIEGSGLGLAICKHGIAIHKGNIITSSKINEGTTFEIVVPSSIS